MLMKVAEVSSPTGPHEPYASVAKQLYAQLKETVPTWL